jgi:carbamoyltransferase
MYSDRFLALFGAPRRPETPFGPVLSSADQRYADLAASIQTVTEEAMVTLARAACARAGTTRLCMAGGVALNSVANGRILREAGVTDLFIQPAAGDSGAALGAALFAHHQVLNRPRGFVMEHAAWGEAHGMDAIRSAAAATGFVAEECADEDRMIDRAADLLAAGRVIGWHQGRFEWGPRALGQRSILADPRRADMTDLVNTKIKFREPYRPFAPSVLADRAVEYFDCGAGAAPYPARFMLLVAPVRPEARTVLPATTHVDNTARLQTVFASATPRYHQLISRFDRLTGVPVLLNTSFNLRGEPIVNTPSEAISTFARSGLDALVLDRLILYKDPSAGTH